MELFLNVKVSSLGTPSQRKRVEMAFAGFIAKHKVPTIAPPNGVVLGYPVPKEFPEIPINQVCAYCCCDAYSPTKKMETGEFILTRVLFQFKKKLKLKTSLILIPLTNSIYINNNFVDTFKKVSPTIATIKTTPKGVVAITKLNRWELESYLDSLVEMYKDV